jgi:methionyl-tRNA formyltransferase
MRMDAGVDTGDILRQRAIPIDPQDTAESLSQKLSSLGGDLLIDTLPDYLNGQLKPISQNAERATYAGMIKKEAGQLDFKQTAASLARQVRAYYPWPGSFTWWQNQPLKILKAHAAEVPDVFPEKTYIHDRFPAIGTISGVLVLDEVQPAGKRPMPGEVFLRGARGWGTT